MMMKTAPLGLQVQLLCSSAFALGVEVGKGLYGS
jgi:hypothetical protein